MYTHQTQDAQIKGLYELTSFRPGGIIASRRSIQRVSCWSIRLSQFPPLGYGGVTLFSILNFCSIIHFPCSINIIYVQIKQKKEAVNYPWNMSSMPIWLIQCELVSLFLTVAPYMFELTEFFFNLYVSICCCKFNKIQLVLSTSVSQVFWYH